MCVGSNGLSESSARICAEGERESRPQTQTGEFTCVPCVRARVPCVCAHVQQYVYMCLVLYMCVCFYVYVIVFLLSGVCAGGGGAGSGLVQNGPIGTSVASERPLTARGAERREEEEESGKSETHTLVFIVT